MFSKKLEERSPQGRPATMANHNGSTFSVIGTDIVIKGDITASADLHVDGKIEGDISCKSLVQGEDSVIEGAITAETARLSGKVKGTIIARELVVLKTAQIEGDVNYDALTIEQGAAVEGRFAPKAKAPTASAAAPAGQTPANKAAGDGEPRLSLAN